MAINAPFHGFPRTRAQRESTKFILLGILLMFACTPAAAIDANDFMSTLVWEQRVLLIFSPNRQDQRFLQQASALEAVESGLRERHMTIIRVFASGDVDIDGKIHPGAASGFQARYAISQQQFRVILVGKDGSVKLDRSGILATTDLFALIDSMPMRRLEMQQAG